jgi:hypothetical protein
MIVMTQVGIHPAFQFLVNILVPHVNIYHIQPISNLIIFGVKLLNYVPNGIDWIRVEQARKELDKDCIHDLVLVFWRYVSVTDGDHCRWSPVKRVNILNAELIDLFQRLSVKASRSNPATIVIYALLVFVTNIVGQVEESTRGDIAYHKYLCQ